MKHLNNKKGAALSAAIIVLMIVMIIISGFYLVANIYYNKTIRDYSRKQAYLYAKNECQALAAYLVEYGSGTNNPYYLEYGDEPIELTEIKIEPREGEQINSGNKINYKNSIPATGEISRPQKDTIIFKVNAKVGKETQTVKLTCTNDNYDWHIDYYS